MELIDFQTSLEKLEKIIKESKGKERKDLTVKYTELSDLYQKVLESKIEETGNDYKKVLNSLEKLSLEIIQFKKEQKKITEIIKLIDTSLEFMEKIV